MNPVHPQLVHVPLALAILMPLIATVFAVAWWRRWLPRKTWLAAIILQAILVVSGFAAVQTGESDEDRVEDIVAEQHIERHEEAAEVFEWAAFAVLLPFLLAGAIRNERRALALAAVATVGTVVVLGLGYRVGHLGGALVYEHGAAAAFAGSSEVSGEARTQEQEHDDD